MLFPFVAIAIVIYMMFGVFTAIFINPPDIYSGFGVIFLWPLFVLREFLRAILAGFAFLTNKD